MTTEIWIAVVACVGAVISAAFTASASRRTARVESSKVDAAAYERAKLIYESALQTLEEQLTALRGRMTELNQQLAHELDTSTAMRMQIRELRSQVDLLEETVADLRLQLSRAGMPNSVEGMVDQS